MPQAHSIYLSVTFIAAAIVLTSNYSLAETLILQSGQQVQGKIVHKDQKSIQVDVGLEIPLTYFHDEIKEILPNSSKPVSPADQLEEQAAVKMEEGQVEEAISLMQQAIEIGSTPMRRFNYASMLFGQAVKEFKASNLQKAMPIFKRAEITFNTAIRTLSPVKEPMFIAQAYFLLGEIYFNAYYDKEKAKAYYGKALSLYDNPSAKAALSALQ